MEIGEKEFERAEARMAERRKAGAYAVAACYDSGRGRIRVVLATGVEIAIVPRDAQGLEKATTSELKGIEISPSGLGLHFPRLNADLYIPGWLDGRFGSSAWMRANRQDKAKADLHRRKKPRGAARLPAE